MNGLRIMFVQASIAYKLSNVIIQSAACPAWRSSFRTIIPQRFLPAPLSVAQAINGIKAPERNNQSNSHYLGLFQRLSMDGQLNSLLPQSARDFHIVPYMTFIVRRFRRIYKAGFVRHVACILQVKRCFSSTDEYIGRIKVNLQEPQSLTTL